MGTGLEIGLVAVSLGSALGAMDQNVQGEKEGQKALDMQAKQNELVYAQKSLSAITDLNSYLDTAAAENATKGVGGGSTSIGATALGAQRHAAKQQQNLEIERDIARTNIETERRNLKRKLKGDMFGFVGNIASKGAKYASAAPTK